MGGSRYQLFLVEVLLTLVSVYKMDVRELRAIQEVDQYAGKDKQCRRKNKGFRDKKQLA